MKDIIQISELLCIGQLGGIILLFAKPNDENKYSNDIVIQFDLFNKFYSIDNLQKFLKFTPFEEVDTGNKELQKYYQDLVYRKLGNKMLKSLFEFTEIMSK